MQLFYLFLLFLLIQFKNLLIHPKMLHLINQQNIPLTMHEKQNYVLMYLNIQKLYFQMEYIFNILFL